VTSDPRDDDEWEYIVGDSVHLFFVDETKDMSVFSALRTVTARCTAIRWATFLLVVPLVAFFGAANPPIMAPKMRDFPWFYWRLSGPSSLIYDNNFLPWGWLLPLRGASLFRGLAAPGSFLLWVPLPILIFMARVPHEAVKFPSSD